MIKEEDYYRDHKKVSRDERKQAQAKDRSKFKKTDKKMLEKKPPKGVEGLPLGRAISITSQGVIVDFEGEKYTCFVKGALKKSRTGVKNLVIVGDFVRFEKAPGDEGVIQWIEPRHSLLSRQDQLSRRKQHLIASNIDQVLITDSIGSPPFKPQLIDRYIIATL